MSTDAHPYRGYWILWLILLAVTVIMILIEGANLPLGLLAAILLVGSAIKATLIIFYYMHLKFEPKRLWILAASPLPLAVILVIAVLTEF